MRLWLKDSERRPDPAPVKTDDDDDPDDEGNVF